MKESILHIYSNTNSESESAKTKKKTAHMFLQVSGQLIITDNWPSFNNLNLI